MHTRGDIQVPTNRIIWVKKTFWFFLFGSIYYLLSYSVWFHVVFTKQAQTKPQQKKKREEIGLKLNEGMNDEIRTCIFWRFSCAWTRLTRSATFRNLLRGFFTSQVATADLHLLRASMELSLFSNSKSFNKLSISLTIKTTQLSSLWVEKIWLIDLLIWDCFMCGECELRQRTNETAAKGLKW